MSIQHQADIAELRAIIADVQTGFNENDPELLVGHFTDEGTAVNVMGALLRGREAMLEASRELLTGPLKDERARYVLGDVTFLGPDVAVAHKTARAIDRAGAELDARDAMIALYVFVREAGRWRIAARQNTLIR
ncbi:SgcJ/EcaC family oxidoreductase [Solirubrobacter sp. CPCC 204708]|uniref:SgcJ/EcaC family oxidoreductase n=1 Tax=Solirubrobacter deserti TaxID=2282478 RepID=A0ABT4RK11_9ACTN|nr:SgcJ/EcaC family oxidoreductase [Solirubrobacter deserti]MBE2315790.1 SgcJ/EcaC family oxidoreductase [Solirubrobacter deserti]MDA0138873.1 SgcJ/EcaC family oxidoreductase [Solirubrobacter deserti]